MHPALSHPRHRLYLTAKERQWGGRKKRGEPQYQRPPRPHRFFKEECFGFTGMDLISHQMWTTCVFRAQGGGLLYGFWAPVQGEPASLQLDSAQEWTFGARACVGVCGCVYMGVGTCEYMWMRVDAHGWQVDMCGYMWMCMDTCGCV